MNDYSCYNAVFVDGLKAFLDYTTPHAFDNAVTNGLIIRRRLQKDDFEKRCIQRWAISELMNLIVNNPQDPVISLHWSCFPLQQFQPMQV